MLRRLTATSPREIRKWCAYALVLLVPGSLVVFPVLWLTWLYRARATRQRKTSLTHPYEEMKGALTMDDRESFCRGSLEGEPGSLVQRLRRWWTPQDAAEQYLAEAVDLAELERRMRVLERVSGGPAFVTFNH